MTHSQPENPKENLHLKSVHNLETIRSLIKKVCASVALGVLLSSSGPSVVQAQDKIIHVQTPADAWQVRRSRTRALIDVIRDPSASQAEQTRAEHDFDARLTDADNGKTTPIETLELFRDFYIPRELEKKPPNLYTSLQIVATQATLGWYDALRFADDSGRAEIVTNGNFFALAFGPNIQKFAQFMKDHPEQAAAAVKAGVQYAHKKIKDNDIYYDVQWPASYGMLRMQCFLQNAKACEKPKPRAASEWPSLLDQAAERVSAFYRNGKDG